MATCQIAYRWSSGDERWEVAHEHPFAEFGIDESMSIDQSTHSLFGASKAAADLLVQEYGRYFGLRTGVFRGGCLTGPAHSAAELHGFLAYLVMRAQCASSLTRFSDTRENRFATIFTAGILSRRCGSFSSHPAGCGLQHGRVAAQQCLDARSDPPH